MKFTLMKFTLMGLLVENSDHCTGLSPFLVFCKALRSQLLLVQGQLELHYRDGLFVLLDVLDEAFADLLVFFEGELRVDYLGLSQGDQFI